MQQLEGSHLDQAMQQGMIQCACMVSGPCVCAEQAPCRSQRTVALTTRARFPAMVADQTYVVRTAADAQSLLRLAA